MNANSMKKIILYTMLNLAYASVSLWAQDAGVSRSPEELKELFGFCEKADLVKKLKFTPEQADKVGEVDYWARQQQKSIDANTNEVFATTGELQQEVNKKYKAFLSGDQLKALSDFKSARAAKPEPCASITLEYNPVFDTLSPQRALLLYKTPYRKLLIDKLSINGRQADMLFETEVWKQKEALTISAIPVADFNRIRRTVAMHKQRESRYKAIGLPDEQIDTAIQFFKEHQIYSKQ
jgi:hypothetical protein